MTRRLNVTLIVLWFGLAPTLRAATTVVIGNDPTKQVLKGTLVTPDNVFDGEVVIEGDTITCVMVDCPDPVGASIYTVTNGYIYPGFIDAHNHVAYNVLPKWTPPKLYQNRGQWQRAQAYKDFNPRWRNSRRSKTRVCSGLRPRSFMARHSVKPSSPRWE